MSKPTWHKFSPNEDVSFLLPSLVTHPPHAVRRRRRALTDCALERWREAARARARQRSDRLAAQVEVR